MSQFDITIGDTFLITYQHGGSGAGTTITAKVKCGEVDYPVTFTWTDEPAGLGEFRADSSAWVPGEYLFQYLQSGAGIVSYSRPKLRFTAEEPL